MTVEAKWGSDDIKFGTDDAIWGNEITRLMADEAIFAFAISAEYPVTAPPNTNTYHVWTGLDDLTVGGITYTAVGPDVLQIGNQQASLTGQDRMRIVLSAIDVAHRNLFLQDPGRVRITVRMLYSVDGGGSWRFIPRSQRGYLSRPQLQGGQYSLEVSPYRDELNRGFEENWSDEAQQKEYPGDLGLSHMRTLSEGADIRWP